ncbi:MULTISPECIES: hypothetical protein [unclassified Aureimonas]|uniref:hypothetical protein n=1 Tax=unclassified Aureimonas TaxID=2615206 RepID=UPI0006F21F1A|nr:MULTISPECIES: hypothetical protein [unclassified Aureimonas]KQT65970.1 helicase [Aureimonas sp. Leaf427]KQT73329.1 helicase [Aureimonas sp. Leaf460]
MLKFKFLLLTLALLLKRKVRSDPAAARFIAGKTLTLRIETRSGEGRTFAIRNGRVSSRAKPLGTPAFTLTFKDGATGFSVLSAKDSQGAFLAALGRKDLVVSGSVLDAMWFQGLTGFLQPPASVAPRDRTVFGEAS